MNDVAYLFSEELLRVTLDGHTTFTLFLTGIKVVSKAEGTLSLLLGHGLELVHLSLRDTTLLED